MKPKKIHLSPPDLLLIALVGCPLVAPANTLINGDFSSGFDNWIGVLDDFTSPINVDLSAASSFYSLQSGGLAELSLDSNRPSIGFVELSQTFNVTDAAHALEITFDWDWFTSDPSSDTFEMELRDSNGAGVNFTDRLFGTNYAAAATNGLHNDHFTVATNTFTGTSLTLRFAITDLDLNVTDTLTVGNIFVNEVIPMSNTDLPIPPSLFLLGSGLLGLGVATRWR